MRIEIARSGGVGGLTRTWTVDVSSAEAEQRWLPLAEAEVPPVPGDERDRFTYRITIGYTEVHLPESRLEEPWRELIDRARAAAVPATPEDPPSSVEPGTAGTDAVRDPGAQA
ncbi:hypothetical protein E8P82_00940 [Arthrobacter echini]|uniref:Uncharacterized protein n=1 Tax=Arthrobacter echini TaxID=1529066 RepID=A0A4S5EA79_9MICC|nr:protealysin inhibitor emfourin [Arthrobacter echini]THJ68512.1 hypothetical protein E8P82_00940 [Arthrobacter echini]